MNNSQPVQFSQKILYLHQKIDYLNEQVKFSTSLQYMIKLNELIDGTIERIYQFEGKMQYSSEIAKIKVQQKYSSKPDEGEKKRLQIQKLQLSQRLKELSAAEKKIQLDSLKIQLQNNKILKNGILRQASAKEYDLKKYIIELQKKIKAQEKQIEKFNKVSSIQGKEIQNLKEDRIRAEKREAEWREKYHNDIGSLQAFKEKKNRYLYRHEQGLKIIRSIVNVTTQKKGCQRLIFCDLPVKFHVIRLVYGIKVGMINSDNKIEYFDDISLYEKEDMQLTPDGNQLILHYVKRKVTRRLEYKVPKNQIVIMLFGKGDGVGIDQTH